MGIHELLKDVADEVRTDLRTNVEVIEVSSLAADRLYTEVPKWVKANDVVVVFADLKGSTKLNVDRYYTSSAKTYEAATGGLVQVLSDARFAPDFMDIQGDGVYALFTGERRYQRALCAAVTTTSFSRDLVQQLKSNFGETFPDTGFKVGIASGTLLGKRIGVRGTNEPVWAGHAVNFAAKCSQEGDAHQVVVTDPVWQQFANNHYIRYSCGCPSGTSRDLWQHDLTSDRLPEGKQQVHVLTSSWCTEHGDEYCDQILAGACRRPGFKGVAA